VSSSETSPNHSPSIPIAILVLDNNQYLALSPETYIPLQDSSNPYSDGAYSQFLADIYNFIGYRIQSDSNIISLSSLGIHTTALKEIHCRFIDTPLEERRSTVWFSCYQHPLTRYHPVHRHSPITFSENHAMSWRTQQPNLIHVEANHVIIPPTEHPNNI
jgi:hypothetical protein